MRRRLASQVRKLDAAGISIVSNNCVAGILYEMAGLPKQSPTAGIYFTGMAYAQFLADISEDHMDFWTGIDPKDLTFKEAQQCWALCARSGGELVFLHYKTPEDAVTKWDRRLERLRKRTPFAISSIRDGITPDSLREPLGRFPHSFIVEDQPAPEADELVLRPTFLWSLSDHIDRMLVEDNLGTPCE